MHDHFGCYVSGAIYLNSHDQLLEFPEINEKVKPEIGSFVIFTSFLKHGCKRNLTNKTKYGISFNIVNNGF
jgi:ectoine hydroxylase-related dioxygenase (phytanoyl-CoA dioxygenase family)